MVYDAPGQQQGNVCDGQAEYVLLQERCKAVSGKRETMLDEGKDIHRVQRRKKATPKKQVLPETTVCHTTIPDGYVFMVDAVSDRCDESLSGYSFDTQDWAVEWFSGRMWVLDRWQWA